MAYKLHKFLSGGKLTAAALNEMDDQIKANTEGVALFTMDTIVEAIKTLRLTTDGEYIYLYYGDTLLNEVPVSDASDIIQCESLTVTSPSGSEIALEAGKAGVSITTAVTPSDCSQSVRFRSSDISVANVNSAGLVSGKALGTATVTVVCGRYSKAFAVSVSEQIAPDWQAGDWVSAPYTNNGMTGLNVDRDTSSKRAISYPYTDQQGIYLKKGCTLKVTCTEEYNVQYYYVIKPGDGELTFTTVYHNGNHFVVIDPDEGGEVSVSAKLEQATMSYTADADCYIALMIMHTSASSAQEFTAEELKELNTKVVCKAYPG